MVAAPRASYPGARGSDGDGWVAGRERAGVAI